jgi:Fe2+ or Zn2+ uptake regulation protein
VDIVEKARELMYKQTQINKAPAWGLTELAIEKGKELAKKYGEDERLIVVSLYLAHTVFDRIWKGEIQKAHPRLSAEFVKDYLKEWKVPEEEQKIIVNAIQAHHNHVKTETKIAEIVKNAECFKFVTVEGSLIWLHELGIRQIDYEEAKEKVIKKMEQKRSLLTLEDCIKEAEINCKEIIRLFR